MPGKRFEGQDLAMSPVATADTGRRRSGSKGSASYRRDLHMCEMIDRPAGLPVILQEHKNGRRGRCIRRCNNCTRLHRSQHLR